MDPRHTSQQCSGCDHISKRNRLNQATFICTSCGFAEHADVNAARNIAARAVPGWAVSHAADDAAEFTSARRGRELQARPEDREGDFLGEHSNRIEEICRQSRTGSMANPSRARARRPRR
ncbi:zinc ribbon domain-containing protein [Nocardia sp. CA-135953]|uniref:zinc ribbon domain-containing protein n=1 Tax=Nocardia sp. CA-135953 TaxID=3239978 RepID=UPI003D99D7B8